MTRLQKLMVMLVLSEFARAGSRIKSPPKVCSNMQLRLAPNSNVMFLIQEAKSRRRLFDRQEIGWQPPWERHDRQSRRA